MYKTVTKRRILDIIMSVSSVITYEYYKKGVFALSKEIGRKLKQLRKEKKWTQQEAAEKLGITRSTISNYEVGRRTPHLKDLQSIAELYGAGLDFFGVVQTDEALDLLIRAREVFVSPDVSDETKESLYHEFMKLYLELKGDKK